MFVDKVKIRVRAGDGGNGCVSFRREKYIDRGGPDGGDGGKGGDVVLVADKNISDLSDFYYQPHIVAKPGVHGRGKNCYGRNAKNIIVRIPIGTQVFRLSRPTRQPVPTRYHPAAATEIFDPTAVVGSVASSSERAAVDGDTGRGGREPRRATPLTEDAAPTAGNADRELIADLVEDGQEFILAKGGKGGHGNTHYKSSIHQAPREFEYGEPGESVDVELELKTLADVGLIGFPNAGKSTLISKITKAHPKVAPYPFTTLTPNVGIIIYDDFTRIRVADIPGLIEGAHRGKGLGHDFLRHIERCQLLVVLLDMAGVDGRKPWEDYQQLLEELDLYKSDILKKPRLVVANKMDLPAAKKNLTAFKRHVGHASSVSKNNALKSNVGHASSLSKRKMPKTSRMHVLQISALAGDGLDKFRLELLKALA